jgi:hypothetical protein
MVGRICLVVIVLLAACSSETRSLEKRGLREALDRTLAADSFHIRLRTISDELDVAGEGDYVAPDRLSLTLSGGEVRSTMIVIGRDHYDTDPVDPARFTRWTDPCPVTLEVMLPSVAMVQDADVVDVDEDIFAFTVDGAASGIRGEARVVGGYVVSLRLSYSLQTGDRVEERYEFSDFGAPAAVEAPADATPIDMVDDPLVSVSAGPVSCP